ncbi:hypothetical protein V5O48_014927 [Marasmius crinis-equi]|uniref:F-box domain-containing protein n=1 Tax=Marasmius crinis-equi TaxID=585013 RepID=A0ABR3EVX8_9AGAR
MKALPREPVTQSERTVITQRMREAELSLKECEAEINRLKASLMSMEGRRDRLKRTLEQCRSVLAPVHQLPPEVVKEVFTQLCRTSASLNLTTMQQLLIPVVLSWVCGRWRHICLSLPDLWSEVRLVAFNGPTEEDLKRGQLQRVIKAFMERSRSHQLQITVFVRKDIDKLVKQGLNDGLGLALEALAEHSEHWSELTIGTHLSVINHPALSKINSKLPKLRTLCIEAQSSRTQAELEFFHSLPALRNLSLSLKRPIDVRGCLPWPRVRDLTLTLRSTAPSAPAFLSLCPNLIRLTLSDKTKDVSHDGHIASNLESLVIRPHTVSFFDRVSLPRLTSFKVYPVPDAVLDDKTWDDTSFCAMVIRSGCSLTYLSLVDLDISDEQVIRILKLTPALNHLRIHERKRSAIDSGESSAGLGNRVLTADFLNQLVVHAECTTLRGAPALLVPRLTELKVDVHAHDLDATAFAEAVTSRWLPEPDVRVKIGVESLQSVEVGFIEEVESIPEKLAALRCFSDVGMRVSIGR